MMDHLITPYGGTPVDTMLSQAAAADAKSSSGEWPSWDMTQPQLCRLELLMNGALSPLTGFMCQEDYESVCREMRLADGTLWPLPLALEVSEELAAELETGKVLALRDPEGVMLAILHVEDVWERDREIDTGHPPVNPPSGKSPLPGKSMQSDSIFCIGGRVEGVEPPRHYDFREYRFAPVELRREFAKMGWRRVLALPTNRVAHRAKYEYSLKAVKKLEANLLVHSLGDMAEHANRDHYTTIRCHEALIQHFPRHTAMLALRPMISPDNGLRQGVLQAIISRNFGCSDIVIGHDCTSRIDPEIYEFFAEHNDELGVNAVSFERLLYVPGLDRYVPAAELHPEDKAKELSEEEFNSRLADDREIPKWFSFPEILNEIKRRHLPRSRQGFTVFFTGLPSSGKSTLANVLRAKLMEIGGRPITLLDGDIVRKHLSSELGFSKTHRNLNIQRIGWVASQITQNGGIAICAPIAPYAEIRREVREMIERVGGFVLVHVSTPVEVCEQRDRKGLYAKARAGLIQEFTGISDPYEEPENPELTFDTTGLSPEECVQQIILHLERDGYVGA